MGTIQFADLQRLSESESPALAQAIIDFLEQDRGSGDEGETTPPPGAIDEYELKRQVAQARNSGSKKSRGEEAQKVWQRYLKQPGKVPDQYRLVDLIVGLDERNTVAARRTLVELASRAPLQWGLWAGIKRVYKRAEARNDAELIGVLAARFDSSRGGNEGPSGATLIYLRRRVWRYLRLLGQGVPEIYPQFAVEVLRHYGPRTQFGSTWVAQHILNHRSNNYSASSFGESLPSKFEKHAFPDAWKRNPDPLLTLLETARAEDPASFAIQRLKKDFPERLRSVEPAWLARLASRRLASVHNFLIETLSASPAFHQSKLRELGLHDAILGLLLSPSKPARAYAIEYARAHATDISNDHLASLFENGETETKAYAASVIQSRDPKNLGLAFLGRILAYDETTKWAAKTLNEAFDRSEIPESFLIDMFYGGDDDDHRFDWALAYLKNRFKPGELKPDFWKKVLDDKRVEDNYSARQAALTELGRFPLAEIGASWLLDALLRDGIGSTVASWLGKVETLPGLDVERLKGFVFDPEQRSLALQILGNTKLVRPRELSLPWLLALARRADPSLHKFAQTYLLQYMKPEDFAEAGTAAAGAARLFALALEPKEPEQVRKFAQAYLRTHHPMLGPDQPESKSLDIKSSIRRREYTPERLWSALTSEHEDIRQFAATIAVSELRAWGYLKRVYELADSEYREPRQLAVNALLKAGDSTASEACTLKPEELDADQIFGLTESRRRTTRDAAIELIRRHYERIGGPERLSWLMQSGDREVRLFAVRILWEQHRPRSYPADWKPEAIEGEETTALVIASPFKHGLALQAFLRRVLFGLPPGRSQEPSEAGRELKRLPANVAKKQVVETVRDLALEDGSFAKLAAPVLAEFSGSLAKGEWQASLAALVQLQAAHPNLAITFGGESR